MAVSSGATATGTGGQLPRESSVQLARYCHVAVDRRRLGSARAILVVAHAWHPPARRGDEKRRMRGRETGMRRTERRGQRRDKNSREHAGTSHPAQTTPTSSCPARRSRQTPGFRRSLRAPRALQVSTPAYTKHAGWGADVGLEAPTRDSSQRVVIR